MLQGNVLCVANSGSHVKQALGGAKNTVRCALGQLRQAQKAWHTKKPRCIQKGNVLCFRATLHANASLFPTLSLAHQFPSAP